jgi:hypothetical protein
MHDRPPDAGDDLEPVADADASVRELKFSRSFRFGKQLPYDILPPETIARLRAGGELSPLELEIVQSAALRDAGPLGELVRALSSQADVSSSTEASVADLAAAAPADANFVAVPGSVRTFEWRWRGRPDGQTVELEPATYYEALTGRRDPARSIFITVRRVINLLVWTIALGLPIGLTALTIATGQTLETIVVVGIGAAVVGMMFRSSLPRTPFG